MTTTEILTGIKSWVVGKLNLKQNVISDLADIRSGAQAGATSVQPADILSYFDNAVYDSGTHRINFYHGQSVIAYVDASPFIVDGMVNDVRIENGYLVIDFNTDSGKQDISIPLTDIFNPNNYYTKSETDSQLTQKQAEIDDLYARIGYYVCSTEGNVAAKTIVVNNYTLGNGGSIKIKMTNTNTVDNATLNINSTGAKALYYAGERAAANNSWEAGETVEVYYDGTSFYANNVAGGSGSGDGAFDVSAKYPTSGVDGGNTYTLEGALAVLNANLSASKKKGGMSIKFIHSSDNNYVRYNLLAQSFTTDTTQWAIADEGVYVENPEFVYVKTDNEGKILWAIKIDGGIYYGAGVPQQVIDYIEDKIADLSLDEYEDIVAFLDDLEKGDKTLQTLLNEKVDKEEGKSLINIEYASTKSTIGSPEFLEVTLDEEDKVLEGIQTDGTKVIGGDLNAGGSANISGDIKVLGNMEISDVSYKVIENPEYLAAWVDVENKVIFGLKADGKTYVGDADFLNDIKNNQEAISGIKTTLATIGALDIDALTLITATENPEFMEVELDDEDKILGGRKTDGTKFENNDVELNGNAIVGGSLEVDGVVIKSSEDPEGRREITLDSEQKIISYRKDDGTLVENVGIETTNTTTDNLSAKEVIIEGGEATLEKATLNSLELTNEGMTDFQQALKDAGFHTEGAGDWSDKKDVQIPIPKGLAYINIITDSLPTTKNDSLKATLEFYDGNGNYWKKKIKKFSCQGNSSMSYAIKNFKFDVDDGSSWKFGHWVYQDSFHLKAFYIDVFVGLGNIGYNYIEDVYRKYGFRPTRNAYIVNTFGITEDSLYTWSNEVPSPQSQTATDVDTILQANLSNDEYGLLVRYAEASYTDATRSKKEEMWYQYNKIVGGKVEGMFGASGTLGADFTTDAMGHPEGFPVELYINGSYYALYAFNMKKDRANYVMGKSDYKTIRIDGYTSSMWNGHTNIVWSGSRAIELGNPKTLICMDGSEYDDDNPQELIDETSEHWDSTNKTMTNTLITKNVLYDFSDKVYHVRQLVSSSRLVEAKEELAGFYDIDSAILHYVISQVLFNYEGMYNNNTQWLIYNGLIMAPSFYDLDSLFGRGGIGNYYESERVISGTVIFTLLSTLYGDEIKAFYHKLRKDGVISTDYIMSFIWDYVRKVGYEAYKRNIDMRNDAGLEIPSYRDSKVNGDNWLLVKRVTPDSTPATYDGTAVYNSGDTVIYGGGLKFQFECIKDNTTGIAPYENYTASPNYLGVYDGPYRIESYLKAHIAFLDNIYEYSDN